MNTKVKTLDLNEADQAMVLVGPEGLVWTQPAFGPPYILAARDEAEQQRVVHFIAQLLQMGLVPYGLLTTQRINQAMFGGSPIRDCQWVRRAEAPAPVGEPGDELPTQLVVIEG